MRRNTPTRIIETGRLARGSSGQPTGWLQNLAERARNLRAQLVGVNERLTTPLADGVPSCVNGEVTFKADTTKVVTITNYPDDPDADPSTFIATLLVNPIILAGQTYRVPVTFSPPGIFQAHNLVVGVEAGLTMFANRNIPLITPLQDYRQTAPPDAPTKTTNVGAWVSGKSNEFAIRYTYQQQVLGNFSTVVPYLPYVWNIIDEKSGRPYAQDWMPSGSLLNTRANQSNALAESVDSELFEFDTPWIFERDAQVAFLFKPLMDLYQVDAADSVQPYGEDDLTGGDRNSIATVRAEFHGNRYYTSQDVLKDGAMVTNARDPSQHNLRRP